MCDNILYLSIVCGLQCYKCERNSDSCTNIMTCPAPMNHCVSFTMEAFGLRCYTCTATDPKSCTDTKSCPVIFNRCFSLRVD
ncbi:hypothetical protein L3Q82_023171, partial [Scortum barcoo]